MYACRRDRADPRGIYVVGSRKMTIFLGLSKLEGII